MKTVRHAVVPLLVVLFLTVLTPSSTASAAPAGATAITCEMVIRADADLYLAHDLTCPTFAVRVVQVLDPEPGPVPHITVDLRGHTLRGAGTGIGITAFSFPGLPVLEVRNGRLEKFAVAVGGDSTTGIRNVRLIGNQVAFSCGGACYIDHSLIKGSTDTGFHVGADGFGVVSHSVFERNPIGARVTFVSGLKITKSVFARNGTGVSVEDGATASVTRSLFVRNRVGVHVVVVDPADGLCVTLSRNVFVRNGTNLVGPRC